MYLDIARNRKAILLCLLDQIDVKNKIYIYLHKDTIKKLVENKLNFPF